MAADLIVYGIDRKAKSHIKKPNDYLEMNELFCFSSKKNCFAIAQLLDYYNNYFSWTDYGKNRFLETDGCMIISKAELLILLEWLCAVGNNINTPKESSSFICPSDELILEALLLIESKSYLEEEFDELYCTLGYLDFWYQKVINSDFDYYYWEYSY